MGREEKRKRSRTLTVPLAPGPVATVTISATPSMVETIVLTPLAPNSLDELSNPEEELEEVRSETGSVMKSLAKLSEGRCSWGISRV